ncbi:ribonuclease HI family protein [bacterium]|nr:ribonuclease HI family protein [bacterium]
MVQIYIDGASRGNPGLSSCAYVILQNRQVIHEESFFLGLATNNQAEYSGLLMALLYAITHQFNEVQVLSDSELLVKQLNGHYRVKSKNLVPYFECYLSMKPRIHHFLIEHIRREKNTRADFLCNQKLNLITEKDTEREASLDQIRELFKRIIREP